MNSNLYKRNGKVLFFFVPILLTMHLLPAMIFSQSWDHGNRNSITGLLQDFEINREKTKSPLLNKAITIEFRKVRVLDALEIIAKKADLELIYNTINFNSLDHELTIKVH